MQCPLSKWRQIFRKTRIHVYNSIWAIAYLIFYFQPSSCAMLQALSLLLQQCVWQVPCPLLTSLWHGRTNLRQPVLRSVQVNDQSFYFSLSLSGVYPWGVNSGVPALTIAIAHKYIARSVEMTEGPTKTAARLPAGACLFDVRGIVRVLTVPVHGSTTRCVAAIWGPTPTLVWPAAS